MSEVTDALLAATIAAGEGRADEAIASLEATFQRHKTAAELLTPTTAQAFAKRSTTPRIRSKNCCVRAPTILCAAVRRRTPYSPLAKCFQASCSPN